MIPEKLPTLDTGFHAVPKDHLAAIVTVLEMTPKSPAAPPPRGDVRVEFFEEPQADWYRALFKRVGAPWLWASRLEWSDQQLQEKISASTTRIFVAKSEAGEEIGYFELDDYAPDKCEIAFLGLVNAWAGRGIGRWLLENAIHEAAKTATQLMIHTCTLDDQRALTLYMKCGFMPKRRAVEILTDPRKKGLLTLDASQHPFF